MDMSCDGMTSFSTNVLVTAENKFSKAVTKMMASCTAPELQGLASGDGRKRTISYSAFELCEDDIITEEDANSEDCSQLLGEKKRRLSMEQVRTLERNFELGNRLEPERKLKLAKALGLHPRQIAIWFQNRRARWKTKQLEKDFEVLKHDYESFKADYHNLQEENKKLQTEIERLSSIFHKEKLKVNVNAVQIDLTANKENERCFSSSCIKSESSSINLIHLDRSHTVEAPHPEGIKSEGQANKYYYIDQQAAGTCHRIMPKSEDTVREDSSFYIMEEQGNCSWWDHWSQGF